jgi:hypothetical protein
LEYRPPAPRLVLVAPDTGATLTAGKDPAEVKVVARWLPMSDNQPFEFEILVNGKKTSAGPTVDDASRTMTANIALEPGINAIAVRAINAWQMVETVEASVRWRRPPRIVAATKPTVGPRPLVDLEARVESAPELPLLGGELFGRSERGGEVRRELAAGSFQLEAPMEGKSIWRAKVSQVSVEPGTNTFRLVVRTADGACLEPAEWTVAYTPPPEPRATVLLLNPERDLTVEEPRYRVQFRVRSASPLAQVQLVRHDRVLFQADRADLQSAKDEWTFGPEVALEPGPNPLLVVATNGGGRQTVAVTLSYLFRPVRLVIDGLAGPTPAQKYQPLAKREDGRLVFPKVEAGSLDLEGRVMWHSAEHMQGSPRVRIWVNGFQQIPAALRPLPGKPLERRFRAHILLNRGRDSLIEVAAPELKQETRQVCLVKVCEQPVHAQQLHLLIVGVGEKSKKQLTNRALEAIQAKPGSAGGEEYTALPAFARVVVYGPLAGYVRSDEVWDKLELIRKRIAMRDSLEPGQAQNNVVMLYFKGRETITAAGHFFLTSESLNNPNLNQSAINCDELASFFSETVGAQVLLLDVNRETAGRLAAKGEGRDRIARWPVDSHVGVLRYAWFDQEEAPPNARLISAFQDAVTRVSKLREVAAQVMDRFQEIKQKYPQGLAYDRFVPEDLKELVVGKKE